MDQFFSPTYSIFDLVASPGFPKAKVSYTNSLKISKLENIIKIISNL